jgi:rhodanese-related sulfurtransferase
MMEEDANFIFNQTKFFKTMKKLFQILFLSAILSVVFFSSCKESTDPVPENPIEDPEFDALATYLVAENLDLPDILSSWIVSAPAEADLATFLDKYDILDLRSSTNFGEGHIEGATNTTLAGVLDAASGKTKPILVVCYTGQTAGHATVALRLSGYTDAVVLKWGMSGWNSATSGSWANSIGNAADGSSGWIAPTGAITDAATFEAPALSTGETSGEAILAARVTEMLNGGFKGVGNTAVLDNPTDYFVNNYWAATDVEHYGNISGAYRANPLTLENGEILNLNVSKQVVTYCWTGQTSSMITAYLSVLGYDAASLKFGTNGMIYDNLESHKYIVPTVDLPLVK